jgi:hypothetical protein
VKERWIRSCSSERGISMVEVVIAGMVLVIGSLAVLALADAANRNTYRAEQSQVVISRLQAEMEKLRQLPFDEMTLTSAPATSTDPASPAHRVSGSTFTLGRDGTDPRPLAIQGGTTPTGEPVGCGASGQPACGIDPGPVSFESGDVSGEIYRYVVYPGVPSDCTGCTDDDLKRIVVAITLDDTASGGVREYQELHSDIVTDRDREGSPPPSGGDEDDEIATFWLTDTPCSSTVRNDVSPTDHDTHNTRGVCSLGAQTGTSAGAPDLMFNEQPAESSGGGNPFIDYSDDIEPGGVPTSTDKGLQILKPTDAGSVGCLLSAPPLTVLNGSQLDLPVETSGTKHQKLHMWLSNELEPSVSALTTSSATLELYTKTVDGAGSLSGKLCFWIFKRVKLVGVRLPLLGGQPVTLHVDLPAVVANNNSLLYGQYQRAFWPSAWTELSIPMNLTFVNVADWLNTLNLGALGLTSLQVSGQPRLGLALQVEKANTTGGGLEFMYDHPNFSSRLEVQSSTCILLCG